ncbi:MAG TPA: SURF1 family cytochrome oxidase biogenesis protein [Allosphingosinicella sp.]|jgi:cytochrome oxidase assembly protein ShyY1
MRFPLLPTALVVAAVAAMIGLGGWQIRRAHLKEGMIEVYRANRNLPPMALPPTGPVDDTLLYRRATAMCLEVTGWRLLGGQSASGQGGTRFIADCRTGAEGPGFAADMGVSRDPKARPSWRGGEVSGFVVSEPPRESLFQRLKGRKSPPRPMIVSTTPAPGLEASQAPLPPNGNSSWSYAFQWFFFAFVAAVIYIVALRRRQGAVEANAPGP